MESTALQVIEPQERQLSTTDLKSRVDLIQRVMRSVMIEGTHYGMIPGTAKLTLFKPGAEVLGVTFKLAPRFSIRREDFPGGHREYECTTTLYHIDTGQVVGEGLGSCSTLESKYRYRIAARVCPTCGLDTISRGNAQYGGWYCNKRKGGCGANFKDGDASIERQEQGRVENQDPADQWNTVLKMAVKRSHVAACLIATAASDIFVQTTADEEDEPDVAPPPAQTKPQQATQPPAPKSEQSQTKAGPLITAPQRGRLFAICKSAGVTADDFRVYLQLQYGLEHTSDISKAVYDQVCNEIENGAVTSWLLSQGEAETQAQEEAAHA